jgi:hypothetical protein
MGLRGSARVRLVLAQDVPAAGACRLGGCC